MRWSEILFSYFVALDHRGKVVVSRCKNGSFGATRDTRVPFPNFC